VDILGSNDAFIVLTKHRNLNSFKLRSLSFQPVQISVQFLSFGVIFSYILIKCYFLFKFCYFFFYFNVFLILRLSLFQNIKCSRELIFVSHNFRMSIICFNIFRINFDSFLAILNCFIKLS
jgi:hypothetical protein